MKPGALLALVALAAAGLAAWSTLAPAAAAAEAGGSGGDPAPSTSSLFDWFSLDVASPVADAAYIESAVTEMTRSTWTPPAGADPYLADIVAAESLNGIPANLLARVLYQESRFREDIITGQKVSSAGALGIAQIVPRWHPNVNPLDPAESIAYAGRYLRDLYRQTGSWRSALAAYNWGIGNLQRQGLDAAPLETRNYMAEILADVPAA